MATNLLSPNGLVYSRSLIGAAPTYQANKFKIKAGSTTAIGMGDLVKTGTGASQGYIVPALLADTGILGVFAGVLPYYDLTAQQTMHGLNGSMPTSVNPSADIDCLVINDPFAVFRAQVSSSLAWAQSWRGQNINFLSGTNGAPNTAGISTLALDYTTLGTSSTLPFRIIELVGVTGGPTDPANLNPWIEVRLNTSELLAGAGI